MNMRGLLYGGVFGLAWTTTALADDGPPKKPAKVEYSATLLIGYGAGGQFEDDTRNNYGFALGGRAGLTLPAPRLYFGLSFVHFAGYDDNQSVHTSTLDAEVGYEFHLLRDRLLIRPQLGLGTALAMVLQSDNAGGALLFHWAPGVLAGLKAGPVLITAEYRRDLVPPDLWSNSNTVLFGCGVRL
ncbi:MAG TPA: hypothetical protein VGC79_12625 [Polyangiaceae bacterium]